MAENKKNIIVLPGWYGFSKKEREEGLAIRLELHKLIKEDIEIDWDSPHMESFWMDEKKVYYKHHCNNGSIFNYPIKVEKLPILNDIIINRIELCYTGKIRGADQREDWSAEVDPHYAALAQKDVNENPREENFDWDHLKQEVGSDIF